MSPDTFAAALDVLCKKNHGFQCSPGVDGGAPQTNIGFQFFCGFHIVNCVLLPRSLLGDLSESRNLRGSIRRPVFKKHRFQCIPGIDGGLEQTKVGFQFYCVVFMKQIIIIIITAITSGAPEVSPDTFAAALDVLEKENMDFSVVLELTAE